MEAMCAIQQMVTAFNMNNEHTSHQATECTEAVQIIPQEQAGSRKNHCAAHLATDEVLTMDLSSH